MKRASLGLAQILILILVAGCDAPNGIGARYELEKQIYDARQLERAAYAGYPHDSFALWELTRREYTAIPERSPLRRPGSERWSPDVVRDIDDLILESRLGLLRLYHVDFQHHASVTHLRRDFRHDPFDAFQLPLVSGWYDRIGVDPTAISSIQQLRAVIDDRALWDDTVQLGDTLLSVPLQLAVQYPDSAMDLAATFYTRIIESWPDSAVAGDAMFYRARLRAEAGQFETALADLDKVLQRDDGDWNVDHVLFRKGEILAFDLGKVEQGIDAFNAILQRRRHADYDIVWTTRLHLAVLVARKRGGPRAVIDTLRSVHLNSRTPPATAARAMLWRALEMERAGKWEEASVLLWRLSRIYPQTRHALVAPLHVIRHEIKTGRDAAAAKSTETAVEFYTRLILRDTSAFDPKHVVKDHLIEACLLDGAPRDAARGLEELGDGRISENVQVAQLKSALLRLHLLDEPEKGAEMLKKSLELLPHSRYSRAVYRELDRARADRDDEAVGDASRSSQ